MRQNVLWVRLLLPVLVMTLLAGAILIEKGKSVEARDVFLNMLTEEADEVEETQEDRPDILIAYDATDDFDSSAKQTIADTLDAMRISWRALDLSSQALPSLADIDTLLICSRDLSPLEDDLERLISWIEEAGGKLGLAMVPEMNSAFQILYRKLGIMEFSTIYTAYTSFRYMTGLLPFWNDRVFDEDLTDYALPVRLEPDCTVHIQSANDPSIPLLWERDMGKGRIAVFNTTLMTGRDSRGYALAMIFALDDTVAYPIINAGMVYVDDFPAPQPEGVNEALLESYGYDIQGVFRNRWWPDMKSLTWDYGLRYTGVLIETYNRTITPPFNPESTDASLLKYYASELLQSGGEIGLHGYNHMPLCPEDFVYNGEGYAAWPSADSMHQSILELVRYGNKVLQNPRFVTYVPPSNYLSDVGRAALLEAVPDLKVISGLYLNETGVNAYVQEFREEEDGTVSVPRISSGFVPDHYSTFVMAQELALHGVFSHFIHPDDILDEDRGALLGWDSMFQQFSQMIASIAETYPQLRFSTSSEGAAAVQRYDRLHLQQTEDDGGLTLVLSNFYDTAWLALRTRHTPHSIKGGEFFRISDGFYWIRADEATVSIRWEEGT